MKNFDNSVTSLIKETVKEVLLKDLKLSRQKRWLRTKDAANYLSISTSQLYHLTNLGIINCQKIGGTNYFDRLEIDQILEEKFDRNISSKGDKS